MHDGRSRRQGAKDSSGLDEDERSAEAERPEDPGCWRIEIGYESEAQGRDGAREEARELVKHLPRPAYLKDDLKQDVIFASAFKALEESLEDLADAEADDGL